MARVALTLDEQRQITQQTSVEALGPRLADMESAGNVRSRQWGSAGPPPTGPVALGTVLLPAVTLLTTVQTITSGFSQPDFARVLRCVTSITGSIPASTYVVINGTDEYGNAISDSILVTGGSGNYVGALAFKTITSVQLPVRVTGTDTIAIQVTNALGIGRILFRDSVLFVTADGVQEAARTIARSTTNIAGNTYTPVTTVPNGSHYYELCYLDERG